MNLSVFFKRDLLRVINGIYSEKADFVRKINEPRLPSDISL